MSVTIGNLVVHPSVVPQVAERLLQTMKVIEKTPERYNQACYGSLKRDFDLQNHEIRCNSACCIAAHIVVTFADHLTETMVQEIGVAKEALRLLGVSVEDRVNFLHLFSPADRWHISITSVVEERLVITPANLRQRIEHYVTSGSMWPTPAPLV